MLKAIQTKYSHIFLDEFQDTTLIQYDLVKTLLQHSTVSLTVVGDVKQRIMAWAGALPEVFEFYYQDFNPKEFEMIINHRSVPLLVEIQTSIVNDMLDNNTQVYPSNKWEDRKSVV